MRDKRLCVVCGIRSTYCIPKETRPTHCAKHKTENMIRYATQNLSQEEIDNRNEILKNRASKYRESKKGNMEYALRYAFEQTEKNHKHENNFNISCDWVLKIFHDQNECCSLSGLKFNADKKWMMPSIDAKNPLDGHTKENCHLVLRFVNYAKNSLNLNDWEKTINCIFLEDQDNEIIYGHNDSKTKESWSVVNTELPIHMNSPLTRVVFDAIDTLQKTSPPTRQRIQEHIESIKLWKTNKSSTLSSINWLLKNKYLLCEKTTNTVSYKISLPISHRTFNCSVCDEEIKPEDLLRRKYRGSMYDVDDYFCNQARFHCRMCRTKMTLNSRTRSDCDYLWNKIKGRAKMGNVKKEYLKKICEKKCPILKVPLIYSNTLSPFQASVDRIDSNLPYDIGNIRISSLIVNYGKHVFDITDHEIYSIFHACYNRQVKG